MFVSLTFVEFPSVSDLMSNMLRSDITVSDMKGLTAIVCLQQSLGKLYECLAQTAGHQRILTLTNKSYSQISETKI